MRVNTAALTIVEPQAAPNAADANVVAIATLVMLHEQHWAYSAASVVPIYVVVPWLVAQLSRNA